jgi:hypothetical protein
LLLLSLSARIGRDYLDARIKTILAGIEHHKKASLH